MKAPDLPDAPDPNNLIRQQNQIGKNTALFNSIFNNPSVFTPFGSSEFEFFGFDPSRPIGLDNQPRVRQNINLNENLQGALDEQQQLQLGLSQLANQIGGQAGGILGQPLDFSGLQGLPNEEQFGAERQKRADEIFNRLTFRASDRFGRQEDALRQRLANQGISENSEAFNRAIARFNEGRNDAFGRAGLDAEQQSLADTLGLFNKNLTARRQGINELLTQRQNPLQEIGNLLSLSRVNVPQFPGFNAFAQQAPNVLGAHQLSLGQGNAQAQQGAQNASFFNQGLGGILGGALGGLF